jgi:hypothetical protein
LIAEFFVVPSGFRTPKKFRKYRITVLSRQTCRFSND